MNFFYCTLIFTLSLLTVQSAVLGGEEDNGNYVDPVFLQKLKVSSSYTVAILPMENMTVDPDIAYHFRSRITQRLTAKGFTVVNNDRLNQHLYDLGITHAGQLALVSFEELGEISAADGFLSGVVEQAARQHAGVYNGYVYMCSVKLQDREGKVIWSSLQNRVAKRRFAIDPINALLDIALVEGGGDSQEAVYALADQMLSSLPQGPIVVITGDSLLNKAIEVPVQTRKQGGK